MFSKTLHFNDRRYKVAIIGHQNGNVEQIIVCCGEHVDSQLRIYTFLCLILVDVGVMAERTFSLTAPVDHAPPM